jgi:hypothetical protein
MTPLAASPDFRVEKSRTHAVVTLSDGRSIAGSFFVARGSARHDGPERVHDLLNSESRFFPFEVLEADRTETVLVHRDHVVTIQLPHNEASQEPGYAVATARVVSLRLSIGRRLDGIVRVYRPKGHDRLSDWAQHGGRFRYIETGSETIVVNVDHVLEAREVGQA